MKKALLVIFVAAVLALPVSAHPVPDLTRQGSIRISLRYDGMPLSGGEMVLYCVGSVAEENGNYGFVRTEAFEASAVSLENPLSAEAAKNLADFAALQKIARQTESISAEGTVIFENLQPGLYLLVQIKAAQGYRNAEPFLVSLPMKIAGEYVYQVDAGPKISPAPLPSPENPEQPKTGQSGWPIWTFLISGTALLLLRRRRNLT